MCKHPGSEHADAVRGCPQFHPPGPPDVRTLRYWERIGLVNRVQRDASSGNRPTVPRTSQPSKPWATSAPSG